VSRAEYKRARANETPSNNEVKRTKPAMAGMARSSPLISVFGERGVDVMMRRVVEESVGYLVFGGMATAVALLLAVLFVCPVAVGRGVRWWGRLTRRLSIFVCVLFLCGLPANVAFTLFMRERFYTDNDPILDWLPWIPSGDWIIDWACQGHYLNGASAWTLRLVWLILAVPVWSLTIIAFRALPSRISGRLRS
jgi:hypothetical protein